MKPEIRGTNAKFLTLHIRKWFQHPIHLVSSSLFSHFSGFLPFSYYLSSTLLNLVAHLRNIQPEDKWSFWRKWQKIVFWIILFVTDRILHKKLCVARLENPSLTHRKFPRFRNPTVEMLFKGMRHHVVQRDEVTMIWDRDPTWETTYDPEALQATMVRTQNIFYNPYRSWYMKPWYNKYLT